MAAIVHEDTQQNLLEKLATELELVKYNIKLDNGPKKGENFVGILKQIFLNGNKMNGEEISLSLIYKEAPINLTRREIFSCEACFNREIYMYEQVLPKFTQIEEANNIYNGFKYAKLYGACNTTGKEALLLEDLKMLGFEMKNRKDVIDLNHCTAVMEALGQLHAFSFALKSKNRKLFENLSNLPETFFSTKFLNYYQNSKTKYALKRVVSCLNPETEQHFIEKMNEFSANLLQTFDYCFSSEVANGYVVICHGDCWINNMFFQYKNELKPSEPTSVCFIDWQLSRCASPLLDVVYYLYTTTDKEFRADHLESMLEIYYLSLSKKLESLGETAEILFPYEEFQKHIKMFSRFGLIVCMILLQLLLCDENEAVDANEITHNRLKYEEMMINKAMHDSVYRKRLHDVVEEMITNKFI